MGDPFAFDAVVVATGEHARRVVAGLSLQERGIRVARKAGAARVRVVQDRADSEGLNAWLAEGTADGVLILSVTTQVVHTPLVQVLLDDVGELRMAIDQDGAYVGAMLARGPQARRLLEGLEESGGDDAVVAAAVMNEAVTNQVRHGDLARHPASTPIEAKSAAKMLYRIVHKPQDNRITRYLYRPVSFPITRALLPTPITPNQISYLVGVLSVIGCVLTARYDYASVIWGTGIILFSSYIDCCDGEIARLRHEGSRFGAWLDTITDEVSQVAYMIALGWHVYLRHDHEWILWTIGLGIVTYLITIYVIYYNLIYVVGSANSQDYVAKFEVVPASGPHQVRLSPVPPQLAERDWPRVIKFIAEFAPMIIRRDFISWGVLILAIAHLTPLSYALLVIGGIVTATVVLPDHLKIIAARRQIRRDGKVVVRP